MHGVDKYNDAKKITDYDSRPFNHTTAVLGAWHGEGTSNTIPRTTFNDNGSSKKSSIFVEDASYFRLKNLELGYTLGALRASSKFGVQNVRLYVSGQNLYTRTKYTGLDPESTDILDRGTIRSPEHSCLEPMSNSDSMPTTHKGTGSMKKLHMVLALIPVVSVFACTDLHKDPVGLLTPDQVSTDPTLNTVKTSVTSSYQMLASTLESAQRVEMGPRHGVQKRPHRLGHGVG